MLLGAPRADGSFFEFPDFIPTKKCLEAVAHIANHGHENLSVIDHFLGVALGEVKEVVPDGK